MATRRRRNGRPMKFAGPRKSAADMTATEFEHALNKAAATADMADLDKLRTERFSKTLTEDKCCATCSAELAAGAVVLAPPSIERTAPIYCDSNCDR